MSRGRVEIRNQGLRVRKRGKVERRRKKTELGVKGNRRKNNKVIFLNMCRK